MLNPRSILLGDLIQSQLAAAGERMKVACNENLVGCTILIDLKLDPPMNEDCMR